ncbi:hypothetical protein QYE76_003020 [Lolium multiflorum]|uniref:RING-type domain-containing protein n=1 Tax=Lolium multiflorum TaxID=4521 RepID=A0AAD8RPP3_LOLMU|nr:probable E3 ubiquitin-protein ligase ATL45 [Lolium perenne]KAK1628705.1 hypothetical protein QYE76_003020 [Lolium multiflorum]
MAGDGNERGSSTVAFPLPHASLDFVPIDPPYHQTYSREEAEEEATLSVLRRARALLLDMELRDDDDIDDDDERFGPPIPRLGLLIAYHNVFPSRAGRVASPAVAVKKLKLETKTYGGGPEEGMSADGSTGCVICIQDYEVGDEISVVPCSGSHQFHQRCIDEWFTRKRLCPLCRHALPEIQRGLN